MGNKNTAIVTTLKDPGVSIMSFINYHFSIGFDHIFLFFDSDHDSYIDEVEKIPNITVFKTDSTLLESWKGTKLFKQNPHYVNFLNSEVMARQLLNVDLAIQASLDMGISWLLHIDNDELFYPGKTTLEQHFNSLNAQKISSMLYLNHEAIPESIVIDDYFQEVTLFKRTPLLFNQAQLLKLKEVPKKEHFLFYSNGKSAGRVSDKLQQTNVHRFDCHENHNISDEPSILHYPVCGLDNFKKKYKILGFFDDKWFGVTEIKVDNPFHVECRDIMHTGNEFLIEDFYKKRVMVRPDVIAELLKEGIYFRETFAQNILRTEQMEVLKSNF